MSFHNKSRKQDIDNRVHRLIQAFESVGRLRRYDLGPGEIDQILDAAEAALQRTSLTLKSAAAKAIEFSLRAS